MLSGWSLDPAGNGGARGMIVARAPSGGREQNPAYDPLRISFFHPGYVQESHLFAGGGYFPPALSKTAETQRLERGLEADCLQ